MSERRYQAGIYRGRGVEGSEQHGFAQNGGEQIAVDLYVQISDQETPRLTTVLSFAGNAVQYSIERLKALGWDGSNELRGIGRNEVDVEIKYEIPPGKNAEVMKIEIKTNGAGRFAFRKPMSDMEKRGFMTNLSNLAKQYENCAAPAPAQAQAQRPPMQQQAQQGQGYPPSWDENNRGAPPAQGTQPYKL